VNLAKTGRKCTICEHPERGSIENARFSGESFRGVSRRFAVSEESIKRHMDNHAEMADQIVTLVAEVAHSAPAQFVTMPLGQQIDRVVAVLAKFTERIEREADLLAEVVVYDEHGNVKIHPAVPELRQWVTTWAQRTEAVQNLALKEKWVALEREKAELMRDAVLAGLVCAGVVDSRAQTLAVRGAIDFVERRLGVR
jgi:hypothetical protein